jgi:alkanesulfonate monooxygenase SsuD/methylene tetrahydromethanopterin reductase-like flavin-dependent oxidoreductase (luciferase family)
VDELIARSADLGFVTDPAGAARIRGLQGDRTVHVFGDLVVVLGDDAAARKARLDDRADLTTDAPVFVGTPAELADRLLDQRRPGLSGFRLRPATLPYDLAQITRGLVPELQRRGAFRTAYEPGTLRDRLGLPRPANRYAAEGAA